MDDPRVFPIYPIIQRTQCSLCPENRKARWYCQKCIQIFCDRCRDVHRKIPSCGDHTIALLMNGDVKPKVCKHHQCPKQYRCKDCGQDICLNCYERKHKGHRVLRSSTQVEPTNPEDQSRHIRTPENMAVGKLRRLEYIKDVMTSNGISFDENIDTVETKIQERYDKLTQIRDSLIQKLETARKEGHAKMDHDFKLLEEQKTFMKQIVKKAKRRGNRRYDEDINFIRDIERDFHSINPVKTIDLPRAPTLVATTTDYEFSQIFGALCIKPPYPISTETTRQTNNMPTNFTIISKFRVNDKRVAFIYNICPTEDGKAWIASHGEPLRLFDISGNVIKSFELSPFAVFAALSSNENLLVSHGRAPPLQTQIHTVTKSGGVGDLVDFPRCKGIMGLVASKAYNTLCLVDNGEPEGYGLKGITAQGDISWEVTIGEFRSYSKTICQGHRARGNFYINTGLDVWIVNEEGGIVEKRKINTGTATTGPIAVDSDDNTIIATNQGTFLVFNQKGQLFRRFELVSNKGRIESMAFDRKGRLWIGTSSGWIYIVAN